MGKKTLFGSLLRPAVLERPPSEEDIEKKAEPLARAQAGREIDARFRDALRRGETSGDFVVLDEQGNEIIDALPRKSIFDF